MSIFSFAAIVVAVCCLQVYAEVKYRAYDEGIYDIRVGPSKYYKELEIETLDKWIAKGGAKDSVVLVYADQCQHCMESHESKEKTAKKVLNYSSNVQFGRIDMWMQTTPKFSKAFPSLICSSIPKVFLITAGGWSKGKKATEIYKNTTNNDRKDLKKNIRMLFNEIIIHTTYKGDFPAPVFEKVKPTLAEPTAAGMPPDDRPVEPVKGSRINSQPSSKWNPEL